MVPLSSCQALLGDPDRVVALELVGGTSRTVVVGDTLQLVVRAVTAAGDTVPGAAVIWAVLDTGAVGFSLDPELGRVIGEAPGKGSVQAAYEKLRTDPVLITVAAAAPAARSGVHEWEERQQRQEGQQRHERQRLQGYRE